MYIGIIARDGVVGLYRGFIPNALKTLPTSRYLSLCDIVLNIRIKDGLWFFMHIFFGTLG